MSEAGFLSTEDAAIPGNNGMKDQVLALRWVKDNIASFGGNPESVTIIGVSAGGASVHFHYFSPLSKGLFHKGVAQSGTALAPWAIRRNPLQRAKKLAMLVGCPDNSTEELKGCLKQRPAQNLLKMLKHFYGYANLPATPFAPTVEIASSRSFLNKELYLLLKEGNVHDVPLVTSTTTDDGLLSSGFLWETLEEIDENWTQIFPYLLDCNETLPESRRESVSEAILDHYFESGQKIDKENFDKLTQIHTDKLFGYPAEVATKLQASVTKSPVYYYLFNYQGGGSSLTSLLPESEELRGVAHGDDTIYCYGIFQLKTPSKQDEHVRSLCQDMLYSFASTGKPSFDGSDIWQPTGFSEMIFLNVTGPDDMKLQKTGSFSSSNFWANLGLLENERLVVKDEL